MEVNKEQARTEQESRTAELQSDMEIKQAEAQKKSAIGQNNAAKEVAESNAELEVTKAEALEKPVKHRPERKLLSSLHRKTHSVR